VYNSGGTFVTFVTFATSVTVRMKVVLATGIYPPDIGGPSTYVSNLARELSGKEIETIVLTYGSRGDRETEAAGGGWTIVRVSKRGGPFARWSRYAHALREHAANADILYAFSSISCGVPLILSRLKHPKRILRLGGDFLWERYTDRGGELGLRAWYEQGPWFHGLMNGILKSFDHIVFSTVFQQQLYERFYRRLPQHSVIENALPHGEPTLHALDGPLKMLFLGRFVAFKNLESLLRALSEVPDVTLTIVGDGPKASQLQTIVQELHLEDRVRFLPPAHGDEKQVLFQGHHVLVLPSHTEISPNAALEARAAGLPVLLTEETGLSRMLTDGTLLRPLVTPRQIAQGIRDVIEQYPVLAERAASPLPDRGWSHVCDEHLTLFRSIL